MTVHLFCDEFASLATKLTGLFLDEAQEVKTRTWQGVDVSQRAEMVPYELEDVTLTIPLCNAPDEWERRIKPNMPWAENHFRERVSGIPHNPPPSHVEWPHAQAENDQFTESRIFSHTYPERFWPKYAGQYGQRLTPISGVRFGYGDLEDVVSLIVKDPHTRQAFLPVFFPEDTGAHHGQRIPCTLGYLFRYRRDSLDIVYYIRSCDFLRHFKDDVYMAGRLAQWMANRLRDAEMLCGLGDLVMHIGSFHVFAGDLPMMKKEHTERMNRVLGSIW